MWRESVVIGETSMEAQEVQEVVQALGNEYKGTAYHLLERNCNHFSNELCLKLTGKPAPSWVRTIHPIYKTPGQLVTLKLPSKHLLERVCSGTV